MKKTQTVGCIGGGGLRTIVIDKANDNIRVYAARLLVNGYCPLHVCVRHAVRTRVPLCGFNIIILYFCLL